MASCFFLLKQFDDVNIYLNSVKVCRSEARAGATPALVLICCLFQAYMYNDDDFNWNYGIAQAAIGNFKEAEETLLLVTNEAYHQECVACGRVLCVACLTRTLLVHSVTATCHGCAGATS